MNISFTFKNCEPSEHLQSYAKKRLEKLGRFLGKNSQVEMQVMMMRTDKFRHRVDVQFFSEGLNLSASETTNDMYGTIDLVFDKLSVQVKKYVSLAKESHRKARNNADINIFSYDASEKEGEDDHEIEDRDHFSPKPMDPEEAALQLEAKKFDFLVFLNSENDRINVIYRRKDNKNYGIIDPII